MSIRDRIEQLSPGQREALRALLAEEGPGQGEPIAIVGMALRVPGADDLAGFWRLLCEGRSAITEVPAGRWSAEEFYHPDPQHRGTTHNRWGGFLDGIDLFDAQFFGISPREARQMDPQQRLLLETAWEAIEDAGLVSLAGSRTGVFIGLSTGDYSWLQRQAIDDIDAYTASGGSPSIAANRLSYSFDLRGPSLTVDTACSSSMVAVHLACQSLRSGESTVALAGGVNVILSPAQAIGFSKAGILSGDGQCRVFDADASGLTRSEGVGVVALKPLAAARADGDRIHAVIRGSAVNQHGRTFGLMAPSGPSQADLLRDAYTSAGVDPARVRYVEAFGFGTAIGDAMEANALGAVLSAGRPAGQPCLVGSLKSNIGHLEAASGIAGLIKTALVLAHRRIPASLNVHTRNPHVRFDELQISVAAEAQPWPSGEALAGVSSFGFGGTGAHLVLEEAPPGDSHPAASNQAGPYLLPVSAHTEKALRERVAELRRFVESADPSSLGDICFTAQHRRAHHAVRAAFAARSRAELLDALAVFPGPGRVDAGLARLHAIAERYRRGEAAPWDGGVAVPVRPAAADHRARPAAAGRVISLPRYPWQRQRHWLERDPRAPSRRPGGSPERIDVAAAPDVAVHEWLVDRRLIDAIGHVHAGRPILPASWLLAQVASLVGAGAGDPVILTGLDFAAPIEVDEPTRLQLAMRQTADEIAWTAHGRPERASPGVLWTLHASGAARTGAGLDARPRLAPPRGNPMRRAELAALLQGKGLELGGTLDAVDDLVVSPDGCSLAADRSGPASPAADRSGPASSGDGGARALFELAELSLLAAGLSRQGELAFPSSCARVEIWPGSPATRIHVVARTSAAADGAALGDVECVDEAGRLRLRVSGIGLPAARESASPPLWFHEIAWRQAERRPRCNAAEVAGHWLIFADRAGVGDRLARLLSERGHTAELVHAAPRGPAPLAGDSLGREGIRPAAGHLRAIDAGSRDEMRAVVDQALRVHGDRLRAIIHAWSLDAPPEDGGLPALELARSLGCVSVTHLVQALTLSDAARPVRLVLLTRGAWSAPDWQPALSAAQAPLWGLAQTISFEHPELGCARIDLDPAFAPDSAPGMDSLLAELLAPEPAEDQIALRDGARHVRRLSAAAPGRQSARPVRLRRDATYLVAGGTGRLGLLAARWMARRGAGHVALVGRSGLADSETRAEIEGLGATLHVTAADIGDPAAAGALFDDLRRLPPLRGILHAAGVFDECSMLELDAERLRAVQAAKIEGTWNLHDLSRGAPLDFFVLFSSAVSVLGSPGQGGLAAADAFLDAFAHRRRTAGLPATCVNWGPWALDGDEAGGIRSIDPEDGFEVVEQLLADGTTQTAVLPYELRDMLRFFPRAGSLAMFSEVMAGEELPAQLGRRRELDQEFVAPRNETEQVIANIWRRALSIDQVGVADRFFELGGDSIMGGQIVSRVNSLFDVNVRIQDAFGEFTIERMAALVNQAVEARLEGLSDADVERFLGTQ